MVIALSADPAALPAEPAALPSAARERLLGAATALFCQRGINATGVDAIVDQAGTAKATLYKLFGSKERLVEAVLERQGAAWRRWFMARLEALDLPPARQLAAVFDVLGEWFRQDHFVGCPFINAVAEYDKDDDRIRALAIRHKVEIDGFLLDLARRAEASRPEDLIHAMGLLIDGAIVVAMIRRNPGVATTAKTAFEALARRHLPTI